MNLSASDLKRLFFAGAHALAENREEINELNVFPVPDGDTGTNMTMTIISSANELQALSEDTMAAVCKAISSGALRGARGNSGVILSQLFRGFLKVVRDKESISIEDVVAGFHRAVDSAYKAVMQPKEGTILTVARGIAEKAEELKEEKDLKVFFEGVVEHGDAVLLKTPELLPVLREAGVVDSGGKGLMTFLRGALDALNGKAVDMSVPSLEKKAPKEEEPESDYDYCVDLEFEAEKPLREVDIRECTLYLHSIGETEGILGEEPFYRLSVQTDQPVLVLQHIMKYGMLLKTDIRNLKEQTQKEEDEKEAVPAEEARSEKPAFDPEKAKEVGFAAVSCGDGLSEILKSLEFDYVIPGGQTMNPSTEDILKAIQEVNARNIFLFPNNGNVILSAEQAKIMTQDRNVIVIPTRTVPECITAKINYDPEGSLEDNEAIMNEARGKCRTIEVTYAVRDTQIDGVSIRKDDFMALQDHHILTSDPDLLECVLKAVSLVTEKLFGDTIVTVYYGSDVTEENLKLLEEKLPEYTHGADVDILSGGQPVYYYLIAVETI
ncbi:MAG: DAK2 domain-containing protein [Lachnospiraceae bacterium]|nr:DAK2 domain-containing protein [Lachnospiraceae bacterium]